MSNVLKEIVKGRGKVDFQIKVDSKEFNGWEKASEIKFLDGAFQVLMIKSLPKNKIEVGV